MLNRTVRKILLIAVIPVFLFSSIMVLKHDLEMRISADYAEEIVQAAVIHSAAPSADGSGGEMIRETASSAAVQATESPSGETISAAPAQTPATGEEEAKTEPTEAPTEEPGEEPDEEPTEEIYPPAPIQVDFEALREKNEDVVAWIYCPDTPINYPVVQAEDNEYYMHRLLNGKENASGTLFMDYRNAADLSDWNSVIYGHNMKNGSMFGILTHYKQPSYFEEHPEIFLLTPEQDYVIKVVAGFVTPEDSELYNDFAPDEENRERLLREWMEASFFDSGYEPAAEDRLITLSTCSYEYSNARFVLVGILKKLGNGQK